MQDQLTGLLQRFDARTLDRLALGISVVLVLLVAQALASLTWTLLPEPELAPPPLTAATSTSNVGAAPDYQQLAALHLFGEARPEAAAAPDAPIDAPETRLNLTLRGILFNSEGERARAIVAVPGKDDEHFRVGDELPGGARIDRIYADRVMLLREGRYETLRLPNESVDVGTSSGGSSNAARGASASSAPAASGSLADYRQQILENPQNAIQYIQANPINVSGGGIGGFRISPGADPRLFELAGLQEGDIVTAVNGIQLDSMDKGLEAMQSLAQGEEVALTLKRNGREYTVRLNFQN